LLHATVPLLNHHTSGVRMEWYRDDLEEQRKLDPTPIFIEQMLAEGFSMKEINAIEKEAKDMVEADFEAIFEAPDPEPDDIYNHVFAPTPITEEKGEREPKGGEMKVMVDCALFAVQELME